MTKLLNKNKNLTFIINGFFFSILIFILTANLKIIIPTNTGWLKVGDGISEISWEFFRRQPIFQFPLGLNPKYGLEISSTMAFDGQIPIMSLLLHPISFLLPDRFQYVGLFLLITFVLNYYFASKIFNLFKMNNYQIIINSVILSLSPVILNRFIENTHYSLTSAWIIFWAIYLCLKNQNSFYQWIILFNLIVLIFFYYMVFVFTLFFINLIVQLMKKKLKLTYILLQNILVFTTVILNMYIIGYFYGGVSSEQLGYGLFRSTLISLVDSSGWSIIIPDLPELEGAYEGFSFLGLSTLIMLLIYLVTFRAKEKKSVQIKINSLPIWISSVLLFLFSLSNKIAFGTIELFEFPIPSFFEIFTNTFRSTGRFSWLLVLFTFIWITIQLFFKLDAKFYTTLITIVLVFSLLDSSKQLISERNKKFSSEYKTNLVNPAWNELNNCYKNIRIYPSDTGVDNLYNFVNLAYQQEMGINTARLGRFSQNALNEAYTDFHTRIKVGNLNSDSFYLFSTSDFVSDDIVNFYKNIALRTINSNTAWGEIDGFTFIAPNLLYCQKVENIKKISLGFGPLETYLYKGGLLEFGKDKNSDKYALTGVIIDQQGFIPQDNSSLVTIVIDSNLKLKTLSINGKYLSQEFSSSKFNIFINDNFIDSCTFNLDFSTCSINLKNLNLLNQVLNISVQPEAILNRHDWSKILISYMEFNQL